MVILSQWAGLIGVPFCPPIEIAPLIPCGAAEPLDIAVCLFSQGPSHRVGQPLLLVQLLALMKSQRIFRRGQPRFLPLQIRQRVMILPYQLDRKSVV